MHVRWLHSVISREIRPKEHTLRMCFPIGRSVSAKARMSHAQHLEAQLSRYLSCLKDDMLGFVAHHMMQPQTKIALCITLSHTSTMPTIFGPVAQSRYSVEKQIRRISENTEIASLIFH